MKQYQPIRRQQGMSLVFMIILALMVGFFAMCAIRMFPLYFEFLSVREIVTKVAGEFDPKTNTIADIRRRLDNLFNTNQIYAIKPRDVEVFREEGDTFIDASYEARVPLFWRFDAVMKFDDLKYVAGEPGSEPVE